MVFSDLLSERSSKIGFKRLLDKIRYVQICSSTSHMKFSKKERNIKYDLNSYITGVIGMTKIFLNPKEPRLFG